MHLTKLSLQNFRPFAKADLDFTAGLNVVVADNGVGKTSMIDAAAVALSALRGLPAPHLRYRDLRATFEVVTTIRPGIVRVSANFGDHSVEVKGLKSPDLTDRHLQPTVLSPTSDALNDELRAGLEQGKPIPMMVRLGAGRAALETGDLQPPPWQGGAPPEEGDGWGLPTDLAGRWVDVRDAWSWLDYGAARDGKRAIAAVEGIHAALQHAIGASAPPFYDPDLYDFVVDLPDLGLRPVHLMSDGWRSTIAIVVALAIRAAECWPGHPDAPSEAVGTVLIDELEQHLHPTLQQQVAEGLVRAFPKLQFIVATHSPYIARAATGAVLRLDRPRRRPGQPEPSPTVEAITGVELNRLRWGTTHEALEGAAFGVRHMRSPEGLQKVRQAALLRRKRFKREPLSADEEALLRLVDEAFPSPEPV